MTSAIVLEHVDASDASGPRGRCRGRITDVSLSLGAGIHALVGSPEDGSFALFDAAVGARRPKRGRVTVVDTDPARDPSVRARIGALAFAPRLPSPLRVRAAVELAMRARGEASPKADAVLSMLGIQALATRRVSALRLGEERAVELALALSTPRLALLALHEPLCDVTLPASADLFGHLATSVEHGACVLVLTSSQADAHALTDHVLVLEKGKAHERAAASVGAPAELTVWVAGPEARSLTSALATHPSVSSLSFRETANPGATPMSEIRLAGGDLEALALELSDTAIRVGANVQAIVPSASAACSWRPWGRAPGSIGLPRGSGDGAAPPHSARPRRGDE